MTMLRRSSVMAVLTAFWLSQCVSGASLKEETKVTWDALTARVSFPNQVLRGYRQSRPSVGGRIPSLQEACRLRGDGLRKLL